MNIGYLEVVGKIVYTLGGDKIGESDIYSIYPIDKISFFELFYRMIMRIVTGV